MHCSPSHPSVFKQSATDFDRYCDCAASSIDASIIAPGLSCEVDARALVESKRLPAFAWLAESSGTARHLVSHLRGGRYERSTLGPSSGQIWSAVPTGVPLRNPRAQRRLGPRATRDGAGSSPGLKLGEGAVCKGMSGHSSATGSGMAAAHGTPGPCATPRTSLRPRRANFFAAWCSMLTAHDDTAQTGTAPSCTFGIAITFPNARGGFSLELAK